MAQSTVLTALSSTAERERERELFEKASATLTYLTTVCTGRFPGAALALLDPGMLDFRAAAPSQVTIRSTAHTARTIA